MEKENYLEIYNKVREVPDTAKKSIAGGRLKGMTDINPMWRIKTLTGEFGPVGYGWYYEILDERIEEGAGEERVAFVRINLYVKYGDEWSKPIQGTGGSSFVAKESKGLYTSDECFKMALTDAISVSCKSLGIGADVYFEKDRSKYDGEEGQVSKATTPSTGKGKLTEKQIKRLYAIAGTAGYDAEKVKEQVKTRFNKEVKELTKEEYDTVCNGYESLKK
ncbi:hypothetical protein [Tissierella praeacuta]|uniref:hypothetical protein n=1 Tax=Tissierella praeacuta TaxID=43131 RepID=UPI003341ED40